MHALCNAVQHSPSGLPIKSALSFIIAEMFNSTLKERCRWLLRLGSSAPCCLQSMLTMTAPFYMICSATNSPNNLWDKASTFLPFSARCLALLQQLLSPPISRDLGRLLLPNKIGSEIPQGPLIVIRKVFRRVLAPSQATANKIPTQINEHSACRCMCENLQICTY